MNFDTTWSATLRQLNNHLDSDTIGRLGADCKIVATSTQGDTTRLTLGVTELDTFKLIKHKLSRHLVQYLSVIVDGPVELSLRYTGDGSTPMRHFLKVLTAHHVLSSRWPEPIWAIPDLLPAGLTVLAGRQKIGKSWLALQLCRAITYGGDLWERNVPRGSFLYLALEDSPRRLQSRMQKQQWPDDDSLRSSGFVLREQFEEQIGYLDDEGAAIIARQIEQQQPRLVIIDTLGRAVRGDHNDYDVMTAALSPIQQVALQKNCAIIIIDHHRKLYGSDIDVVVDILGSSAKAAVADTLWGIYKTRGSKTATLGMVGRDVEDQKLRLEMDDAGCWQKTGDGDDLEITPRRQEILDTLSDLGLASLADVSAAINQNRGNTYTRLRDLVQANIVERVQIPDQPTQYRLAQPNE